MLVSDINTYVRAMLDSDSTECPDSLILSWIGQAEGRCFEAIKASSFYRTSISTTSSTSTAVLTTSGLSEPTSIHGPNWELVPITALEAKRIWPKNVVPTDSARVTGPPTHWSVDYASGSPVVQLWPSPSSAEAMVVKGERFYTAASTNGSTIDFPTTVAPLIEDYCVAKGYILQQDATMAQLVMARFEGELDIQQRRYNRDGQAAKASLGGERSAGGPGNYYPPDSRLRFPWE